MSHAPRTRVAERFVTTKFEVCKSHISGGETLYYLKSNNKFLTALNFLTFGFDWRCNKAFKSVIHFNIRKFMYVPFTFLYHSVTKENMNAYSRQAIKAGITRSHLSRFY